MKATKKTFTHREYYAAMERDRERFHGGPSGSQTPAGGPIGIEGTDGLTYCVGCYHCTPISFEDWRATQESLLAEADRLSIDLSGVKGKAA